MGKSESLNSTGLIQAKLTGMEKENQELEIKAQAPTSEKKESQESETKAQAPTNLSEWKMYVDTKYKQAVDYARNRYGVLGSNVPSANVMDDDSNSGLAAKASQFQTPFHAIRRPNQGKHRDAFVRALNNENSKKRKLDSVDPVDYTDENLRAKCFADDIEKHAGLDGIRDDLRFLTVLQGFNRIIDEKNFARDFQEVEIFFGSAQFIR